MATVFDISGPLGLYRKPYTTTSSVSFPIPPPTAVGGLLANILGIANGSERESCSAEFWRSLGGTRIAIQRLNPTAWLSATINFTNPKSPEKNPHIRVKHQFIKDPHFRIFVQGGLEERLREMLETGRFIFTPTLGAAYTLADIAYRGWFDFEAAKAGNGDERSVCSAVSITEDNASSIDFIKTGGLMKETFPFRLDVDRALEETILLLYPSSPDRRIVLKVWEGLDVTSYGDDWIAWLPAW